MRESWPHAPPHYFTHHGTYIITAATLHRKPLFDSDTKLDLFRDTTLKFAGDYALILEAWAFFANHYHLVASFEHTKTTHRDFVRHLHRELAIRLNQVSAAPGRRVMYEFWDTHLTFETSWLARLNYVHQNPVKHHLVSVANQYRWCSAAWFESNARSGFVICEIGLFLQDRSDQSSRRFLNRISRSSKSDARTRTHSESPAVCRTK